MSDLGFTYTIKGDVVTLYHNGKQATVLRGRKALDFVGEADSAPFAGMQQLMARLTGNYKHGNERHARNVRKERYKY